MATVVAKEATMSLNWNQTTKKIAIHNIQDNLKQFNHHNNQQFVVVLKKEEDVVNHPTIKVELDCYKKNHHCYKKTLY